MAISARLMDDKGTIGVNITTKEDFDNAGTIRFKPDGVADPFHFLNEKFV